MTKLGVIAMSTRNRNTKPVLSLADKRALASKLIEKLEAGDEVPPDEGLWLAAWCGNATPTMQARLAKVMEVRRPAKQPEPPKKRPSEADIEAIDGKLDEIGGMLMALHEVASADFDGEWALKEMATQFAKRGIRVIDAIHLKLGQGEMGNFAEEFEETA
jgi:hypothetical protein